MKSFEIYRIDPNGGVSWISTNVIGTDAKDALVGHLNILVKYHARNSIWLCLPGTENPNGQSCLFEIDFKRKSITPTAI